MACSACGRRNQITKNTTASVAKAASSSNDSFRTFSQTKRQDRSQFPYNASDIKVYQSGDMRGFIKARDFPDDMHKLIIFYPKSNTPVCETELGALEKWKPEFEKLGFKVIAATIDFVPIIKDWFTTEDMLKDATYPVLSSRILPQRLGLLRSDGTLRRSSVFIMKDGEQVRLEHFDKVGRSLAELHRMAYGYSTDSYCAEGWKSPADGFLEPPKKENEDAVSN